MHVQPVLFVVRVNGLEEDGGMRLFHKAGFTR